MYQNLASEMRNGFKPLMNVFDIQNRTAQRLLREQTDFLGDCLEVSTRRAEALRGNQEPTEFFRVTVDTNREIGERWLNTADRQWNILMEARRELTGEVRTAAEDAETSVNRAAEQARANVSEAADEARSATAKSAQKTESTSTSKKS